jgi:hypothetical protein
MKDKKFIALSTFFFLLFIGGILAITLENPTNSILRARDDTPPSAEKSFVVVFPQIGRSASGNTDETNSKIKVIVTIRDASGAVLPNRQVKLAATLGTVQISPSDLLTTNTIGQAEFSISSPNPGTTNLSVTDVSSNISLSNIPSVEFTP